MKQITFELVLAWLERRAKEYPNESGASSAYKLGMLASTFSSLLNNPHTRKDLIKEIANEKPIRS